jgi:hypothetical protein
MIAVEIISDSITYIPSFMKIYIGIEEILRSPFRNSRYRNVGTNYVKFMNYTVSMESGTIVYIPNFMKIS